MIIVVGHPLMAEPRKFSEASERRAPLAKITRAVLLVRSIDRPLCVSILTHSHARTHKCALTHAAETRAHARMRLLRLR
jgi:hypothetical protein